MSIERYMWPRHCFNKFTSFKESSLATAKPVTVWYINIQYYTYTHTYTYTIIGVTEIISISEIPDYTGNSLGGT